MKRDNIFWGAVLILFGVLFLLQNQGIISNVFQYFWPLALILVGGWIVLSVYWKPTPGTGETFKVDLGTAKSVSYKFSHGAAQILISGGAAAGQALVGSTATAMEMHSQLNGDRLDVRVETGPSFIPFVGPAEGIWQYHLTQDVPVTLTLEAGASSFDVDLKDVQASRVNLKMGASTVKMTLPARGASYLEIEAGAASFDLRIPETTTARVSRVEGVTALNVDTTRFPQLDSGVYQSPDYDTATNRVEIVIKAGMASVTVK